MIDSILELNDKTRTVLKILDEIDESIANAYKQQGIIRQQSIDDDIENCPYARLGYDVYTAYSTICELKNTLASVLER